MSTPNFVHLRLHTEYSISDSTVRVDNVVEEAAKDGQGALAITDASNLFGLVKFYKATRGAGVKPIIGVDAFVESETEGDSPSRILLLAQNKVGYLRLCDWLSRAFAAPVRGQAQLRRAWFEESTEGLIALSGFHLGDVGACLLAHQSARANALAKWWAERFPNRYYIELQRAGHPQSEALISHSIALANELALPVVATHPTQYLKPDEFTAHEARVCIATGFTLGNHRRPQDFTRDQYFLTQSEMATRFADIPEAIANTVEVAKRCNVELTLGKNYLPEFPVPAGRTLDEHLRAEAFDGLMKRVKNTEILPQAFEADRKKYEDRLDFEIKTIIQMGFPGYFLIVADFINWAKTNGVPVGPGRGSGAGSLVAFSLGITDLDPLQYGLLFERFLNPERVSMPDFDIDFCQDGRDRVIDYVRQKYGAHAVSQIATFGTMAAKAAVRDIGRVMDLPYGFVDGIAKLIPFTPGKLVTLEQAQIMEPALAQRVADEEDVRELIALAQQVEGLTRNVGMHAGGVLIAPGKLTDFCPLYAQEAGSPMVSQFDKDDVEAIGLVKFDFLGLTTLTVLDHAVRHIRALKLNPEDELFDAYKIPLDDARVYKIFQKGETTAIFQFESSGMRSALIQAKPDRLEDLIALNALYRPGPMEFIPTFCNRKQGREKVEYLDQRMEPLLGETYGIMVYQEQVMQVAQVLGGYSLGGADLLRRAMGKKKAEEMAQQREVFQKGAAEKNIAPEVASEIFDQMETFAGYGFNKSHSAAYAYVAYQTAYCKVHHPAAFMAANLSAVMNDSAKVREFLDDASALNLRVIAPDVNTSEYRFVPISANEIRYGLGAVKGSGEGAAEHIVAVRNASGPFVSLFDFCKRVDKSLVNKRALEVLAKSGAFDSLHTDRARVFASLGLALESAEQAARDAQQTGLFADDEVVNTEPELVKVRPWDKLELLTQEKSALGLYLSGHPFEAYSAELRNIARTPLAKAFPKQEKQLLAGIITGVRVQMGKRGKMCFVTIDDASSTMDVMVFAEVFDANRHWLKEDQVIVVEGRVSEDRRSGEAEYIGGLRTVADGLFDLSEARKRYARRLAISLNGEADAAKLLDSLRPYAQEGSIPVAIEYTHGKNRGRLTLGEQWKVWPHEQLMAKLGSWIPSEKMRWEYE
jgi:DNA polymerase III subunit alpha